jgi:ubiquinone/menaquinone biosynthesis C-methylase UbiE
MQHYDVIAGGYEYLTEKLHGRHRREAVDLLHPQPGWAVLDAPCGTGANLPLLQERLGPNGEVIELDYSAGMLARARAKVERAGWSNVRLVQADARDIHADLLGRADVDAVICMLGLSVVPDWEQVFDRMWTVLRPGGRFVAMDLYLDGRPTSGVANRYYRLIAQADSRRRFWEPLGERVDDLTTIDHRWFGGVARVVAGTKPGTGPGA